MFPRSIARRLILVIFVSSTCILFSINFNGNADISTALDPESNRLSLPSDVVPEDKCDPNSAQQRKKCKASVSCYVMTSSNPSDDRMAAINETWLSRCSHGQFFTKEPIDLGIPHSIIFPSSSVDANEKAIFSLRYAYHNISSKFDWYYLVTDDTYVVVENMCQHLQELNPDDPYFFAIAESKLHNTTLSNKEGPVEYVLSRAGIQHFLKQKNDCSYLPDKGFDLNRCLRAMDINSLNTRNKSGQERFYANRHKADSYQKNAIPHKQARTRLAPDLISLHHLSSNDIRIYHDLIYRLRSLNSSKFYIGDTTGSSTKQGSSLNNENRDEKTIRGQAKSKRFYIDVPLCPNSTMNEMFRHTMLAMHNNFRSSIAIGNKESNGGIEIAPPAGLMYNMIYQCDAERLAELHVQTCDGKLSSPHARPGFKENIYILRGLYQTDLMGAAQKAVVEWWSELEKHGIRSDMLYTEVSRTKWKSVSNFSKMAWWNNVFIGCAIQTCDDFYFISCMYGPGGNIIGAKIYETGAPCSGCGPTCNPGAGLCTWNRSLLE